MKNSRTPWSYRKGSTLLHRLSGGIKLISMLLLSLAAFIPGSELSSFIILAGIALVLIILSFISRIGPSVLLQGSGPLFIIVLSVFIVRGVEISPPGFNAGGLKESLIFCFRIGIAFAAGSLLFSVTTSGEIRKSLSRAEAFLHLEKLCLSLHVSLMLGFLPRFFEVWENLNLAWESRGGRKNISRLKILLPLAMEQMMIKASRTASALESRGYLNSRTQYD